MSSDAVAVFEAVVRQEVDQQVATAKAYPRSIEQFLAAAKALVTMTQAAAEDCIYALPRKDKDGNKVSIEGPSARFAEVLAYTFKNSRVATRIMPVGPQDTEVIAQAVFYDVENNVARSVEYKRRITYSKGGRYSDDMVLMTANAAASIAARNATLQGIPRAVWEPLYEAARKAAVGDAQTFATTRSRAMAFLAKMGANEERVLAFCKVAKVEDITAEMLLELRGVAAAIRDGDAKLDDVFPDPKAPPKADGAGAVAEAGGVANVKQKLKAKKAAAGDDPQGPEGETVLCIVKGCGKSATFAIEGQGAWCAEHGPKEDRTLDLIPTDASGSHGA
jgi:hypothetical protein